MKEVIVRLTSDRIKVKGGEYVQDLVRCGECKFSDLNDCQLHKWRIKTNDFCSYGEVRDE